MIEITANPVAVPNNNLQKLLTSRELIKALARQLVAGQVEGHIEMMSDCPSEYQTFLFAEQTIVSARECCVDYVEDLLVEFRDTLYAEIANVKITVDAVKMTKEGAEDADVTVS